MRSKREKNGKKDKSICSLLPVPDCNIIPSPFTARHFLLTGGLPGRADANRGQMLQPGVDSQRLSLSLLLSS
jgi:hypothetical protein